MRLCIFLLILWGCTPETMVISEASEIQFWRTGVETSFNLEQEGYTDEGYCFHQKFLCSSQRRFQGYDADGVVRDYFLVAFDEDGNELFNQIYDVYQEFPGNGVDIFEDFPTSGWDNDLEPFGGVGWGLSGSDRISTYQNPFTLNYSKYLTSEIHVSAQTFEVTVNFSNTRICDLEIVFYNNGVAVGSDYAGNVPIGTNEDIVFNITTTEIADSVLLRVLNFQFNLSSHTATIHSAVSVATPETGSVVVYSLELTPSEESMCDKMVQFKNYTGTEITDDELDIEHEDSEELFYTDFVDFVSVWANGPNSGRIQMQYRSIQNFDDLIYDSESEYFNIELEGRFRKERKITAQKAIELTDMVLNTASSIKKQTKLTLDDLPDYMHTKVVAILAHAASGSVLIKAKEWSVEEEYEEGERPESYPLTPAEIWLTEKDYYKHNVT